MKTKLYLLVCLWSLDIVSCNKKAPSELNAVKDAKDNKANKSIEFLHKIKEDLRRNNDDYAEAMARTITTTTHGTIQSDLKFQYRKENSNIIDDLNRRAYESLSEEENARDSKEVKNLNSATVKRFLKITQATKSAEPTVVNNMNKLQKIFNENKDLLKEFINNIATTKMIARHKPDLRMKAREPGKEVVFPTSEQLDMAPAKGGRIHMLRIKGRLCQRNVLIPEGPKYDSKGMIYLPAFAPAGRKKFENTIAPKIILPRCCNCCKKSVLGCE